MPNESAQQTVFLSYAHADQAQAQRLANVLQRSGLTVWWDALIEGGSSYATTIKDALAAADAVIVLWSRQSVESDWVRDEAAQGRDRRRLVPLSLDGTPPPLGFGQIQMIDISRWNGRSTAPLFQSIQRALATAMSGTAPAPPTAIGAPVTRRKSLLLGGGAIAALAGGGALAAWKSGLLGTASASSRSIAVLPFKNLSGDPAQAYLSDGLTDEIRSALTRNAGLQVLAGTSTNSVRDMTGSATAIARKLGVAYLLDGSVQRMGNMVQVATNLTDGSSGFSAWSQRVERPLGDMFAFESDIAQAVSSALSVQMATSAPAPGGTHNVQAYEAYLRGRALFNLAKDEASDNQARAYLQLAVEADPNFALAHAALSRTIAGIAAEHAAAAELKGLYAQAIAEAQRSVDLAPTLPEANLALGYALFAGRLDLRGARPFYDRAYRFGRGDSDIVLLYALYNVRARRIAAAREAIERSLVLDPLNPRAFRAAGSIAFAARNYPEAAARYRRAIELNPAISNARAAMGDALLQMGRTAEARAAYESEPHALYRWRGLAILEHRTGNDAAAQHAFEELVKAEGDAGMFQQAEVMAQWGQSDRAFAMLGRARAIGDSGMILLATDPFFDPIAKDPRFAATLRAIGFA